MITKVMVRIFCIFILSVCMGCASARQIAPMIDFSSGKCPSNKSCIYVIRPAIMGSAIKFQVYDNNQLVGETGPRSYLAWQKDPGQTTLVSMAEDNARINFDAEAGATYYVLQSVEIGFMQPRSNLIQISEDQAEKYLKNCHAASR